MISDLLLVTIKCLLRGMIEKSTNKGKLLQGSDGTLLTKIGYASHSNLGERSASNCKQLQT